VVRTCRCHRATGLDGSTGAVGYRVKTDVHALRPGEDHLYELRVELCDDGDGPVEAFGR
jgi:hypothetical protein